MRGGQQSFIRRAPGTDLSGQDLRTVLPADDFERFHRVAERVFAGEVVSFEGARDGRTLRGTISPLRGATGEIDRVLNVAFDVTDERAREERATRDEKLRALGQMAGGIAHDLNQALTLVAGYGELAREALNCEDPNPNPVCEMIRIMERAAYDGGATVRRLLTFVRGGEQEPFQAVDVGGLLHEVEQLTAPRWRDSTRVNGNRVTLRIDAAPGLAVFGSQSALREMLTNLVFNAVDAMPEGGSIVLAARPVDDHVLIDVADTGLGMSPEIKARVFEPFFTTKGQAGSGLGLAMVFGIVQRHQGQIDITSDEGRGTTIHLTFPAADRVRVAPALAVVADEVPNCRILVVDDEPRLAALLVGLLRHEGHVGITAQSAEEALERLASERFDLVITDLSMGEGMNGWELAAAIAASPAPVPVVLATGWGAGLDEDEARNRSVSGVVAKPYRRADIHAVVARVLADRAEGGR
jgi:signal transduction histidine kinase/ActR/RegA family two-component response regulator